MELYNSDTEPLTERESNFRRFVELVTRIDRVRNEEVHRWV